MVTLAFAILTETHHRTLEFCHRWLHRPAVESPNLFGLDVSSLKPFYYLCLAVLVIVLLGLINLIRAKTGRAFMGVRDSEAAAYSLGIWVNGYKVLAFVISAAW
jgi:branched-chain amino acid transport system permease protein